MSGITFSITKYILVQLISTTINTNEIAYTQIYLSGFFLKIYGDYIIIINQLVHFKIYYNHLQSIKILLYTVIYIYIILIKKNK